MIRKSKYTAEYKRGKRKNPIPFPHLVKLEKKEVYFKIDSGWPASLTVKPIMREHFPDDFKGIIASDETWKRLMKDLPPHFLVEKEKKVVFLIKGVFPEHLILNKYLPNFPEGYKGMVMRCEESFYKMRMKANSK